jgi:hypothetical protein
VCVYDYLQPQEVTITKWQYCLGCIATIEQFQKYVPLHFGCLSPASCSLIEAVG